jgi:hypothetical protein
VRQIIGVGAVARLLVLALLGPRFPGWVGLLIDRAVVGLRVFGWEREEVVEAPREVPFEAAKRSLLGQKRSPVLRALSDSHR